MDGKVLLIEPPFQKFIDYEEGGFSKGGIPVGLLSLAGQLKKNGYDVGVWDSDYNNTGRHLTFVDKISHYCDWLKSLKDDNHPIWEEVSSKIEEVSPDVVGISMISTKYESGLKVAKMSADFGARVIVGGPHATLNPSEIIQSSYVDSVVSGEGELVFERAMREDGIISAERIKNLDILPWIARETLLGLENYNLDDLGYLMTSRGCPGSCNYCCSPRLWGREVRKRSISDVVEEMDHVNKRHGVGNFYLIDDTFTMARGRVFEFCNKVRDKNYTWSCLTRVDCLNEDILENMLNSGCSMVKIGLESGSQRVLDLMRKGTTIEQAERAGDLLNKYKMSWLAYVMVDTPGERAEDVEKTIELIEKARPSYVSAAHFTPYFGTGFWDSVNEKRLEWARVNHHSVEVLNGEIPKDKIMGFFKRIDEYNENSRLAHDIYKNMGK